MKLLNRREIYRGRVIEVIVDEVILPNQQHAMREVVRHPGGAVALAFTEDGRIVFVRQPRYPLGRDLLELPAGKLDPGENPAVSVLRELEEETGYRASEAHLLTSFYPSPGFCDELLHLFVVKRLSLTRQNLEHDEMISVELYRPAEALELVRHGEIQDAKTIIGLLWAQSFSSSCHPERSVAE